jgi:hypothetical protein
LGLVIAGILIVLGVKYFTNLLDFAKLLLDAFKNLIYGAMLAFLLNLSMDPIEKKLRRSKNTHIQKKSQASCNGCFLFDFDSDFSRNHYADCAKYGAGRTSACQIHSGIRQ